MSSASAFDLTARLSAHDFDGAAQLLAEGLSIDATVSRGRPVVEWAFAKGDREIVDWVMARDPSYTRPGLMAVLLHHCQAYRDPELLSLVLSKGDKGIINERDNAGRAPLMRAMQAVAVDLEWCRLLMKNGADVNATGIVGDTMLMVALTEKRIDLLKEMAAAGADPNLANQSGQTAAHAAVLSRDNKVLKAFLAHFPNADLNRPAESGTPPIMMGGTPAMIATLLSAGADANVRSANPLTEHHTLLMSLIEQNASADVIERALEAGASPLLEDDLGRTAGWYAVEARRLDVLPMLYERGLPFHEPLDRTGVSPYHALLEEDFGAAMIQAATCLQRVPVDLGCRPGFLKARTPRVASPLRLALAAGKFEHAQLLMEAGAQVDALGPDGHPALHGLVNGLHKHLRQEAALQANDALRAAKPELKDKLNTDGAKAEWQHNQDTLNRLIDQWASASTQWDVTDPQGKTLLHHLVTLDSPEWAARLMALGASPLVPEAHGWTALDEAVLTGQVATVHTWKGLLATQGTPWTPNVGTWVLTSPEGAAERQNMLKGMESLVQDPQWATWVNTPDADGNTPLILAVATEQPDVATFLLAHGAQALAANALGETALHHATALGDLRSMEHLRAAQADPYATTASGLSAWDLAGGEAGAPVAFRNVLRLPNPEKATWSPTPKLEEEVARGERWGQKTPASLVRRRRQP